ncbi:prenylated Rab acceptor protein 1 [Polypterus senegalus]|uniref:prenylated Rab acceptor protein 1 n=1 Tax=Polypterus senegalus TaxID=55291 RepID=UPI001964B5A7|nr:prenylated Rab acceptor protein 1 [Polypterus senegalus]XP_039629071.1 prenylated Rab acceptor protein 1 [Polypterus senegalus]XP_039629072.1 prenylated Rab acceptor protein 1 [Polypterus senegalus]XP_039629073.1 prenylated Rab acceptor protein 1 [Polypterus senegalus]
MEGKSLDSNLDLGGITGQLNIPKVISGGAAKEWFDRRRSTIRPWSSFGDQRRFSKPKNFGEVCKRLVKNLDHFQSNYIFVFLGLIAYCVISSPMLLIALAVFFGALYIIHLKAQESKLILFGREVTAAHQYGLAGGVSFPFFWLAGAGSAVFWVLGATMAIIGSHAAFHEIEGGEECELTMEPV